MTAVRTIECYDKTTEALAHELVISPDITVEQLRKGLTHYDLTEDPDLCLGYPITADNVDILKKITQLDIPYTQYNCFLAVYEKIE